MEDKRRGSGGRTALHVLAFIGVAVLLIAIALTAALWITTKGPSETARDEFVAWADDNGLGFVAGLFVSDADEPGQDPNAGGSAAPEASEKPMIVVAEPEESPAASGEPVEESPAASDEPATSEEPETSPATSGSEEAQA